MRLCPFEDAAVPHLAPLASTRAVGDLRVGIRTLLERQLAALSTGAVTLHTRAAVRAVTAQEHGLPVNDPLPGRTLLVNARWLCDDDALVRRVRRLTDEGGPRVLMAGDTVLAAWLPAPAADLLAADAIGPFQFEGMPREAVEGARFVTHLWDLIDDVPGRIAADFAAMGQRGDEGAAVHEGALIVGEDVYLAPGAEVKPGGIVDASAGPVYLAEGAVVEHGAVAIGPLYLGEGARIKALSRVDGSAIGPHSKVGGEVHESVVVGFSNKGHDGYLGNSYLGRWCNLGADTNTSNLKNDYGGVTVWDAVAGDFVPSGRQFAGLFMADHSKCSINTMFNTGTVVGVFCNLYGAGFPPRYVPDFSWGGAEGFAGYRLEKALRVAEAVMARRSVPLTDADRALLGAISEATAEADRTS